MSPSESKWDAIIVGGGCAGLSAAVYLSRAMRKVLVIDSGQSLALWEPDVQNYFGFPEGISGQELIERGRSHATKYGAKIVADESLVRILTTPDLRFRENPLNIVPNEFCLRRVFCTFHLTFLTSMNVSV